MKLRYIIFLLLAVSSLTFAQKKRYLISPTQEVIPLDKNESARFAMEARAKAKQVKSTEACSNSVLDGFTPVPFDNYINSRFGGYHKDVFGEWFIAKYTGTIDTIYWNSTGDAVGAKDSLVYIRIHESFIGPNYGPGIRPGPYNPPCQNWGYWRNSNDLDRGVAAFIDDATDTTWVSTIAGSVPSGPPFGNEIWGLGGYPVTFRASQTLHVALADLIPFSVTKGDLYFVSMRINGPAGHVVDDATRFYSGEVDSRLSEFSEYYPTRTWKFYEHDSGPTNCAGVPINDVSRGWVARGGFTSDTLTVAYFQWWMSMTTNDNTPPQLLTSNTIYNTYDNGPQTVSAEIEDCDPSNPAEAGITSAYLRYVATSDINGASTTGQVDLSNTGGNTWEADIPGQPAWTQVTYTIIATDTKGLLSIFPQPAYRIIAAENNYAKAITEGALGLSVTAGCDWKDISATGTEILGPTFFKAPSQADTINPAKDDGTSGPYHLGTPFYFYGKAFNYVWVGINGAITLSENVTDTNDVNANGSYTTGWTMPGLIRYGAMRDTGATARKPKFLIAANWQDLFYGNRLPETEQYGHIYYQDDACEFTVQWGPGMGVFGDDGGSFVDDSIHFRVILSKCDGTIKFQYQNIGNSGLDTLENLVGISADTIPELGQAPWLLVNQNHHPPETDPMNGRCITIYQKGSTKVNDKWNMVSVATVPVGNDFAKSHVFPTATTNAFAYSGGYQIKDPLDNGSGVWLKFSGSQVVGPAGAPLTDLTIPVALGWNLIGTISCPVATSTLNVPPVVGKTYYGFEGSYVNATTLVPGKAYWVKADEAGTIHLTCNPVEAAKIDPNIAQLNGFSSISVRNMRGNERTLYLGNASLLKVPLDRYEMPPLPMEEAFDVRFASNRSVETYTNEANKVVEYTIQIQSNSYPVALQYNIVDKEKSLVISENNNGGKSLSNTTLNGRGVIRITNPSVTSVKVRIIDNAGLPKDFALSQNYPNPFNPVTRFSVDLPTYSNVDISVYDILGHKITTLMSGQHDAGSVTIEWDGKDGQGISSPSGVYFVRMTAGSFSEVRKIMLLK